MSAGGIIGGRYRLLQELGSGSYGKVYEAETNNGKRVALKVIREALLVSEDERQRFEREAEILYSLEHENIVRVLDVGYTEQRAPFIVFELLKGRALSADLKRVRFMSATRVAGIARQVLRALDHAHSQGVVHRDIKPSNIFLCHADEDVDRVKVLDFGVAKPMSEGELERLTQTGVIVGTPGYIAPEQLRGDAVGGPADLFAVGMVMARLLSGERLVGDSMLDVIRMHIDPAPIPLPRGVVLSELGGVIAHALEKRPENRYPTAAKMLEDIEVTLHGVASAPTSASGTLLMPEHLLNEASPNSTIPLDDMPWLRDDRKD